MAENTSALEGVLNEAAEGNRTDERIYAASQWQLMWWRLRRHKLAMAAGIVLVIFYCVALGADFLSTSDPTQPEAQRGLLSPQRIHLFDGWKPSPHVLAVSGKRDPITFQRVYEVDPDTKIPIRLFARGFEYEFLGLITTDRHLIGQRTQFSY